jgi:imidazolonepropionase
MLVYNIGQLLALPDLYEQAFLRIEDGRIAETGPMSKAPPIQAHDVDARGQVVIPGFVDCHTHLAHAGGMSGTFADRCNAVEAITEADLRNAIESRLTFMQSLGTTTVEIKTGYATSVAAVRKCLAAIPNRPGVVITEMSPLANNVEPSWLLHNNPRFVDVLCDPEGLSVDQLRAPLASMKTPVKLHVCVSSHSNGVELALDVNAVSVEHLLHANPRDIELLSRSNTIAVLLPAMAFFSKAGRFAPARALLDAGVTVALATDANPGDSPTYSMPFVMQLAAREMHMTAFETICAATLNAAKAIHEDHRVGSLTPGKDADFLILASKDYRDLPPVERVFKSGQECLRTYAADASTPASFF